LADVGTTSGIVISVTDGLDTTALAGFDITIDTIVVIKAFFFERKGELDVWATSEYGAAANLQVDGYGPMSWDDKRGKWELSLNNVLNPPSVITVRGPEGSGSLVLDVK